MESQTPHNQNDTPIDESDPWNIARSYSTLIGEVPDVLTSVVRKLARDYQAVSSYTNISLFMARRLLRAPGIKAPVYYFARSFYPTSFEDRDSVDTDTLLNILNPHDLACILATLYIFRRLKRICPAEEWQQISDRIHERTAVAGHMGVAIPDLGLGNAILLSSIRHLALGTFLAHHRAEYQSYRQQVKTKKVDFDHNKENLSYGCTSLQVSGCLIQVLGIGVDFADALTKGLNTRVPIDSIKEKLAFFFRTGDLWVANIEKNHAVPDIVHDARFYPTETRMKFLEQRLAQHFSSEGGDVRWFEKAKEDISPELTPELFVDLEDEEALEGAESLDG